MTYNPKDNYCTYSPDTILGVKINKACYNHDRQYRNEVRLRKTRLQADIDFRDEIYSILVGKRGHIIAYIISRIYYYAVRIFSVRQWEN